ncbi:hypothetical protein DM01DRAFT_1031223 [Hesseltinella vesiculosa]|uniref:Velvet domain-containing protein n=1 Tax=Hesseltinella vesiculosa TaxID=101127 RepID=A0A1X2GJG4_9FUNG|nr:hypothetical protein DM01DRAFT_1031223 [Hesseltinella vesiculosa]
MKATIESRYKLVICQQPIHARSAGFGNRDRRLIDPPPLLQLYELQGQDYVKVTSMHTDVATMVVHCDLYDAVTDEPRHLITLSPQQEASDEAGSSTSLTPTLPATVRTIIGTMVSNAHELENLQGERGIYFVFGDLSIRNEGHFRLKFQLVSLFEASIHDVIFSESFRVYRARQFPGALGSTHLSRHFAQQGVKLSIRAKEKPKDKEDDDRSPPQKQDTSSSMAISSLIHPN